MLLRSRFLSRQIDVESMTKPAENADHSPKYRFAECWTLDPAVYRLADEHRAAQISTPNRCISYMGTAVYFVHTQKQRTNHSDCDKRKRLAKRGWLLLYRAAVVYYFCLYFVHCSFCGTAFEIQLLRSLCWSVVLRSYDMMAHYGRKQNNYL